MNVFQGTIMNITTSLITNIINEVHSFASLLLGLHPGSIFADVHERSIMITLQDILSQVEKEHISEEHLAELITKNHIASYNAVKQTLEAAIAAITGQHVTHSSLLIDAEANVGTIVCTVSM